MLLSYTEKRSIVKHVVAGRSARVEIGEVIHEVMLEFSAAL